MEFLNLISDDKEYHINIEDILYVETIYTYRGQKTMQINFKNGQYVEVKSYDAINKLIHFLQKHVIEVTKET